MVDNTFATPVLFRPIEHGADVVVHSATKYLGGHDDVTLGLIVSARQQTHRALWKTSVDLGVSADPFAAWLTIRGLKTLPLRMDRHCQNAAYLAGRLAAHPAVAAVFGPACPATPITPSHAACCRDMAAWWPSTWPWRGEAGLRFITAVRLAAMATTAGWRRDPCAASGLHLPPADGRDRAGAAGIGEGSIRVSVGLEHPEDLWADFEQALAAA